MPPYSINTGTMPFESEEMQLLITCNQKLKDLGIDSTINLPQICVIGDQSAGKSSLIEALSLIKVPRAANRCTQCPLSMNISAGDNKTSPWKCVVSIEQRFNFNPSVKKISKTHPMGPWIPTEMTNLAFATTSDKEAVCDLIRAAQLAILNPGRNHLDYVPRAGKETPTAQLVLFSPNCVKLEISEGNGPSLSFVDLPGIIASTNTKEEKYLIDLVRNLSIFYATDPSMVNILTLPMSSDLANSSARGVIQELRAESRTMEVFTKPDRVCDAEREEFMVKFTGQRTLSDSHEPSAQYGHHIVMMQQDPQVSQEDARKHEKKFFNKKPWVDLGPQLRVRLGIEALRERIRVLLFEKTRETLPANLQSIEQRLLGIKDELAKIPPPPELGQLPFVLVRKLHIFGLNLAKLIDGNGRVLEISFRSEWMRLAQNFSKLIADAKPTLILQARSELGRKVTLEKAIEGKKNKQGSNLADAIDVDDDVEIPATEQSAMSLPVKNETAQIPQLAKTPSSINHRFTLEEIRHLNSQYDINGLPRPGYPEAIREMMRMSVRGWSKPLNEFMQATSKMIIECIDTVVNHDFEQFSNYPLVEAIRDWVKQYLDAAIQNEWNSVDAMCEVETIHPFTLDNVTVSTKAEQCSYERLAKRKVHRLKIHQLEAEAGGTSAREASKLTEKDLGADEYKIEVDMSAQVRAYYEVACVRFTDGVCQKIVGRLFTKLSTDLARELEEYLGPDDENKRPQLQLLIAENPQLEQERQKLVRERERLIEGREYIRNVLGVDSNSSNGSETQPSTQTTAVTDRTRQSYSPSPTFPSTPSKRAASGNVEAESTTKKVRHNARNMKLSDS